MATKDRVSGLVLALIVTYVTADSCVGKCNSNLDFSAPCQCNSACLRYNDCCADFSAVCLGATCSGRCGQTHDNTKPCQCNTACSTYNDCCTDYSSLCLNGGGSVGGVGGVGGTTLGDVIQSMWNADNNRLPETEVVINPYGSKLFTYVAESRLGGATYQAFINLLDNYNPTIGQSEEISQQELQETEVFLDAIMATNVMSMVYSFLDVNGKVGTSPDDFRAIFKELWFNLYGRSSGSSTTDSSGFEHVMVGETKTSTVSGFHSWVQFYLQEKAGNLQYTNMVTVHEPRMKGAAFRWFGKTKSMGSFFLGTSPEFDLGVYTLCALMHPNSRCTFTLQGNSVSIQTYDIAHKAGDQIGTAYPAI